MSALNHLNKRTAAAIGAIATTVGAAGIMASPTALADSPDYTLVVNHTGTITTHLKTLNQDVVFQTTEQTRAGVFSTDGVPWSVASAISPSPGHSDLKTSTPFGVLKLAGFDIKIIPTGPATGTLNPDTGALNLSQTLNVQITKVTAFGINLNLVPNTCVTSTPATTALSGSLVGGTLGSVNLQGTLNIPSFANCGLLTPILNLIASGPGNTVSINLGKGTLVGVE